MKRPNLKTPDRKTSKHKTKKRTTASRRQVVTFPQVNGKTIAAVEFSTDDDEENNITLKFHDKTALSFDIYPQASFSFSIMADYADWTTGDWRPIKRWPHLQSAGRW
jgi:hypothetical protein